MPSKEIKKKCYWFSFSLKGENQGVCNVMASSEAFAYERIENLGLMPSYDHVALYVGDKPELELDRFYTSKELKKLNYKSGKDIEENPYLLDRKKFIEYVATDNPDLLTPLSDIKHDLIKGSEYILTAQDVLDSYNELPSYLIEGKIEEDFIPAEYCKLTYNE